MTSRDRSRLLQGEAAATQHADDAVALSQAAGDPWKRMLDVAVAGTALVLFSPLALLIAALIRLDSRGPVLFRQQRVGQIMEPFEMLKFRTMRVGSDQVSPEELKQNGYGPTHKQNHDPRITRMGRLLRRLSLDEFPQLINVLRGDMSLVGPRPLLGWELEDRPQQQVQRTGVKPGLTGLWQVSGRSELSFDEMIRLDLEYVRRRSFRLDLNILLRTIPSVLTGKGAY